MLESKYHASLHEAQTQILEQMITDSDDDDEIYTITYYPFFEENLKYLVSSHHRENTFVTENEFFSLSQQYHDDTIDHEEYGQVIASYEDVDWSDSENECEVQERLETVWGYVEDTEREAEENVKNIHSEMKDLFGPSFLDLEENLKKLMDETEREMEK